MVYASDIKPETGNITKSKVFFENGNIKIIHGDFLTTNMVDENTIDLIVTSPPYNVGMNYNLFKDDISYNEYLEFTEKWLNKAYKLVKDDGRMCLDILLTKRRRKGIGQQSIYADITYIAKKVGWKHFSTIVWNKQNISKRTAWGSWLSAKAPYIMSPVEVIAIFYKNRWKKERDGKNDIEREEFINWTYGMWTFPGDARKNKEHPAPFPLELPKRCIKLFSYVGDVVLDPFLGSGTTLVAAALLNRKGIGVEIDEKYCRISKERLLDTLTRGVSF